MNKVARKFVVLLIKIYQLFISPLLPKACRYYPTCSEYTVIAVNKYGIIRGLVMGVKRILRCHPFGGSGHDPVL